jgi:hypothetical protein
MTELSSAGYSTLFKQHAGEGAPFLISWISPWQKDVSSIKRLFTTKILFSVNHYFYLDSCSKRPLIGVLIALTRPASLWMVKMIHIFLQLLSLVPVYFFVTDAEKTTVLAQWLDWVKQSAPSLSVKRIMIDCSATEIAAIKCTFGDDVQILLCHWHIKRSWKTHLKKEAYLTYLLY